MMFTYFSSRGYHNPDKQRRAILGCIHDTAATWTLNFWTSLENSKKGNVDEFWPLLKSFGESYNKASVHKKLSTLRLCGSKEDYSTKLSYRASA